MADQWFGDLAELTVDGNAISIGSALNISRAWKKVTAPATWVKPEVNKPTSYTDTITVPFADLDDHADFLILWNLATAAAAVPVVAYPEGNTAGKLSWSGNAYVEVNGVESGIDKAAGGQFVLNITGGLTPSPNIVLAATALGTTAVGASSAYSALSASGGTSTYSYAINTGILPEGVSMSSGGVFSGTVAATANVGTYIFEVTVTDSAATPVVKTFRCTCVVSA